RLTVTAEQLPTHQELPAQLRDAARRQTVLVGHIECPFAEQEVIDDPTVTLAAAANPQREVKAKDNLLRHRRLRVIAETLLETVLSLLAVRVGVAILVRSAGGGWRRLHPQILPLLGPPAHYIPSPPSFPLPPSPPLR